MARFGGGDNAGHSIVVGDTELALRIVPSGAMHPNLELFVGGGTVVDPVALLDELHRLSAVGVDPMRVKVSDRAHAVLPYHAAADRAAERARGDDALGTTGRGIGPAYADKAARTGLTFAQLMEPGVAAHAVRNAYGLRTQGLRDDALPSGDEVVQRAVAAVARLAPHVVDGVAFLHDRMRAGKRVLIEGAQGSLLDVGYGTYPFVTSSHTIAGGACTGLGIGPNAIGRVIGIAKAYCTRVGSGPFPSELDDETGERLRRQGAEFGTVTGRARRCGWFDAVAGRYAVALNGLSAIALTKLDVLSGFDRLGIVVGYREGDRAVPFSRAGARGLQTDVEWLDGWKEPLGDCRRIADLPAAARRYVARIETLIETPIEMVSVGRERSQLAR